MRDVIVVALACIGCFAAFRRPWVGIVLWTWLSVMNPHRYTWGFAYSMPLAAAAAVCTLLGLLYCKDKDSPFKGTVVTMLVVFMAWVSLSWVFGLDPAGDYPQWNKVMKIDFMILIALMAMRSKEHIFALAWVTAGSLALLGAKGGVFTILTGGSFKVWGPPGSFIEDNNEFALALVMTIPLLRFLQLQLENGWGRRALTAVMVLLAVSAAGSQSRGALLAITAMAVFLWWRGKNKLATGTVMVVAALSLAAFLPQTWFDRMNTITEYQEDGSAMGRISAWWNAWNLAFHYPLGVGFDAARPELFALYSPYPNSVHAAHSIYFQVLGNHGFIGLFLFIALWWLTWRIAARLRKVPEEIAEARWCRDLGAMVQTSFVAYFVGGAFLSLAYFDLPYDLMAIVVLAEAWVVRRGWEHEPVYPKGWRTIPGLAQRSS